MSDAKHRIVVVDDDADMNTAMARLLNAAGFSAVTFPSAEDLLKADVAPSAACFVFDVHLTGSSGFELAVQLRRGGCRTPIIFITAHDDPTSRTRAHTNCAAGYFIKPFPGQEFLAAVTNAVRHGHRENN